MADEESGRPEPAGSFKTTRWSVVHQARDGLSDAAAEAMDELCRAYWPPVYLHIRRRGHDRQEAEDLTQQFFAELIGRDFLASVEEGKGRFRSFLLASLRNFLNNRWHRATRQKRGGGRSLLSLDDAALDLEAMVGVESGATEEVFDRDWALHLLRRVMGDLRAEHAARHKLDHFEQLRRFLTDDVAVGDYERLGGELGMAPGAVKIAVHRLRARYRALLLAAVAETVSVPGDVQEEVRHLLRVLRSTLGSA
jgi:RNA polymerase sigma-70 factor (ECF subfamily)